MASAGSRICGTRIVAQLVAADWQRPPAAACFPPAFGRKDGDAPDLAKLVSSAGWRGGSGEPPPVFSELPSEVKPDHMALLPTSFI